MQKPTIIFLLHEIPLLQFFVSQFMALSRVVEWAQSGTKIYQPMYRCNGDAMRIFVIRVEDTRGFKIVNN